jgi:hypothetical protein
MALLGGSASIVNATAPQWQLPENGMGRAFENIRQMCSFYVQFRAMQASIGRMRRDQIADRHPSIL